MFLSKKYKSKNISIFRNVFYKATIIKASNLALIFLSIFLMGCNVGKNNWIDNMIEEMNTPSNEVKEKNIRINEISKKYLLNINSKEEIFKKMVEMKEYGFEIHEYRKAGSRIWPDGSFKDYMNINRIDRIFYKNVVEKIPDKSSEFLITKTYRLPNFFIEQKLSFSFILPDEKDETQEFKAYLQNDFI